MINSYLLKSTFVSKSRFIITLKLSWPELSSGKLFSVLSRHHVVARGAEQKTTEDDCTAAVKTFGSTKRGPRPNLSLIHI